MYLRETRQKRADGSVITHLQLAESVWNLERGRAETRIVYNCGRAEDPTVTERLRRLARSILRRASAATARTAATMRRRSSLAWRSPGVASRCATGCCPAIPWT